MKRILIVCGCDSSKTPVVNAYVAHLKSSGLCFDFVEYDLRRRFRFVVATMRFLWRFKYTKVVLINPQALILAPYFRFKKIVIVYWKLEMTFPLKDLSLVNNLGLLEYLIKDKASLIVSNPERLQSQRPEFSSSFIVYNAPYNRFIDRVVLRSGPILNLVMYGNLDRQENLYLDEWVDFAVNNVSWLKLTVIGTVRCLPPSIVSLGKMAYSQLIQHLIVNSYDYSIVGYEPRSLNTLYAAPNKLIESMALGMGIIVNERNLSCVRIVEHSECGFKLDFQALDKDVLFAGSRKFKIHRNNALSYSQCLLLERSIKESSLHD